uniref:Interferon-related developmental regulator 2 n=1 Tax=Astyanax mexicanus TaxID=7994 RepID=A0A8B9KQD3_ASTMX
TGIGESGASDDELASEVLSHYSSASESASVLDEGSAGEGVDEQTAQEETEDKLKQCIDNMMDKSAKTRLAALTSLRSAFSSRLLYDFLLERRLTVSDCLERSLKKGEADTALLLAVLSFRLLTPPPFSHLPRLQACLDSSEVNFRIAVGETIALLYELGRDFDEEYEYEDCDALCESLKGLATDGNKHRAKNDRRKQRSIFREVLHYIESDEFSEEKIRFGVEVIYIDGWMRRRIYDAFKEVLESGISHHLQHLFNSAAFKARTKLRNKVRDKRADVM